MKYLPFIAIAIIAVTSCSPYQRDANGKIRKPELVNETFQTSKDSMLIKCADLKGFGPFIIGKTTFKKASKESKIFPYGANNSFYGLSGSWASSDDDISKKLEKDNRIKRLKGNHSFNIGELKFHDITLAFYNDTLVAISFDPEYDDQILNYYLGKYGNGNGHKIIQDYFYKDYNKDRYYHDIAHTWYNEKVNFSYKEYFKSGPNIRTFTSNEFLMNDNTGKFEKFLEIRQSILDSEKEIEKTQLQESYDML